MNMPNPETDGRAAAIAIASGFPIWRADLTKDEVPAYYEHPEALDCVPNIVGWRDDEAVSKSVSWNQDDLKRLCLDGQPKQAAHIPNVAAHRVSLEPNDLLPLNDDFDF
jgi:hypothetical protein